MENEEEERIQLITCIGVPLEFKGGKINDYRRWATHLQYESKEFGIAVRERYLNDPLLNFRPMWRENLTKAKPYDRDELDRELRIDWDQWENRLHTFLSYEIVWVEPGSETDFLALCRIDLLEELARDRDPSVVAAAVVGIGVLGVRSRRVEGILTRAFGSYQIAVRREAILAAGRLRSYDHADLLIEALEGDDAGMKKNALWGLRQMSGLTLTEEPGRWRLWLESEREKQDEASWVVRSGENAA